MWVATKWAEVAGTKMSECLCFIYAMLPEWQEQENQSLFWDFTQYFQDPRSTANIVFRPDKESAWMSWSLVLKEELFCFLFF